MILLKLFILCFLTKASFGQETGTNLTKNFDLDSIISNLFGNQATSYPGNSQNYPSVGQNNPQNPGSSNINTVNPGNNYQGYPSNVYQGRNPQYQRPGNGLNSVDPRYNYQRPFQGYPPNQDTGNGINNINPGNNYPSNNYPGYYQDRPNQINNPQGNVWNNANENPGINYPVGSQFFPGTSSQGSPQYQRPGGGFSGNSPNGLPGYYPSNPGVGNWNGMNGRPDFHYDQNDLYPNLPQSRPGVNWNSFNGYPNNQNPNQISVPGNQFQTQGVGSQGFDQQNPSLMQYPQGGHTYRPGLQNGGLFNPSQGSNGLNNQLPNLQNKPDFKPSLNNPNLSNGLMHKNGLNFKTSTEKSSVLGNPVVISQPPIAKSPSEMKQCVQDCPSSTEYSPRCGNDNVTYFNEEKVQCARKCGFDVKIIINGACPN